MPYNKPDPALVASSMMISDGLIAVTLRQLEGIRSTPSFLVIRADNAETVGYYTLPTYKSSRMCFSRNDGFTFLVFQEGKLALLNAPLR
jgi:hypothetical protein